MISRHTGSSRLALTAAVVLTLACASTPDARIQEHQALFDTYAVDVKASIRQGKVAIGFDEAMTRMAMGDPDEKSTEMDETGDTLMWGYVSSRPGISVGIGGGSYGGSGGMGGGASMGSGPRRDYTAIIEFREGRVTSVRRFDQ